MAILDTRIFTGADAHEATAKLNAALADGSWPLVRWEGYPVLWITPIPVTPGAMQMPRCDLYVTAWVEGEAAVEAQVEASAHAQR